MSSNISRIQHSNSLPKPGVYTAITSTLARSDTVEETEKQSEHEQYPIIDLTNGQPFVMRIIDPAGYYREILVTLPRLKSVCLDNEFGTVNYHGYTIPRIGSAVSEICIRGYVSISDIDESIATDKDSGLLVKEDAVETVENENHVSSDEFNSIYDEG